MTIMDHDNLGWTFQLCKIKQVKNGNPKKIKTQICVTKTRLQFIWIKSIF